MPRPANVARFNFGGSLPGGERFVFGLWGHYTTPPTTQADFQSDVGIVASDTSSNLANLVKQCLPTAQKVDTVTGYFYGAAGATQATFQAQNTISKPGLGSVCLPNQIALCATLQSGLPGRSYRGRIYLPWLVNPVDTVTGQLAVAGLTATGNALAGLIHDIKQLVGACVVVSDAKGIATPIASVKLDTKLDTQRRRARADVPTGSTTVTIAA